MGLTRIKLVKSLLGLRPKSIEGVKDFFMPGASPGLGFPHRGSGTLLKLQA